MSCIDSSVDNAAAALVREISPWRLRASVGLVLAGLLGAVRMDAAEAPTNSPIVPFAASAPTNAIPGWLTQPMTLLDAVNMALQRNSAILKSSDDLEANHGVVLQVRAVAMPKLRLGGAYNATDAGLVERFPFEGALPGGLAISWPDQKWSLGIQVSQPIYGGGRMRSSLRAANLTEEQAILVHQSVINDTVTEVRVAYAEVLASAEQILVRQKSVELLERELLDVKRRFDAGTVPRFNVLRAEVELANARPKLIAARNDWRLAKNSLANLLGCDLPAGLGEDLPLNLLDKLVADTADISLSPAIAQALERRPELAVLRKAKALRQENIIGAKAGYKPTFDIYAGYQGHSSSFDDDLGREVHGWAAGAQMSWDIWDGWLTKGKVQQAKALLDRAEHELDDQSRRIELEVRSAYSTFVQAREVLLATEKVVEQGEEAYRLAQVRADAGTATQLDVFAAETALTEAGTTRNVALRACVVARARLDRAIGQPMIVQAGKPAKIAP